MKLTLFFPILYFLSLVSRNQSSCAVQLMIRNKYLKFWIERDLHTLRRMSNFHMYTMEKMERIRQKLLTCYYDLNYQYYNIDESNRTLMDTIVDLIF